MIRVCKFNIFCRHFQPPLSINLHTLSLFSKNRQLSYISLPPSCYLRLWRIAICASTPYSLPPFFQVISRGATMAAFFTILPPIAQHFLAFLPPNMRLTEGKISSRNTLNMPPKIHQSHHSSAPQKPKKNIVLFFGFIRPKTICATHKNKNQNQPLEETGVLIST